MLKIAQLISFPACVSTLVFTGFTKSCAKNLYRALQLVKDISRWRIIIPVIATPIKEVAWRFWAGGLVEFLPDCGEDAADQESQCQGEQDGSTRQRSRRR